MDEFNRYFVHMPEHKVVICKDCKTATPPGFFAGHLQKKHRYLSTELRRNMVQTMNSIEGLATTADEIVYPQPESEPIPHLPILRSKLKCIFSEADGSMCGRIYERVKHMQIHCREEHGWVNPRKRGRTPRSVDPDANKLWVENVQCQQFGKTGGFQRLFEVGANQQREDEDAGADGREVDVVDVNLEDMFKRAAMAVDRADKKSGSTITEQQRISTRTWVKRAGWDRHLGQFNRKWLLDTIRKPGENEKGLARLLQSVEVVIWMAQQASRVEVVGLAAMNYVERREVGCESNERPFYSNQMGKTMVKYSAVFKHLVSYICRTHGLEEIAETDKEDVTGKKPGYRLTGEQQEKLDAIKELSGIRERKGTRFSEIV